MSVSIETTTLWLTILGLGALTFFTRFLFLGLIKHGALPGYVIRLLRYVPVTVLPAMIAPMVIYPSSLAGITDPIWLVAASVTLVVGMVSKNLLATIVAGMGVLWGLQWIFSGL